MPTLKERVRPFYRQIRRLENNLERYANAAANGDRLWWDSYSQKYRPTFDTDHDELKKEAIAKVEGWIGPVPGLFVNDDPRGWQLKVEEDLREDLTPDMGGYGIIGGKRNFYQEDLEKAVKLIEEKLFDGWLGEEGEKAYDLIEWEIFHRTHTRDDWK